MKGYKYYEEQEAECTCLECGMTIAGRKDKKFCSLNCKNTYNNRRQLSLKKYKSGIISRISRNYEILEMLIKENITSVSLEELKVLGFDSSCVTGQKNGECRHSEHSCFDISYYKTATKIFNVHREDITRCSVAPFQGPSIRR